MKIGEVSTVLFARGVLEFTRQCWLTSDEKIAHETAEESTFRTRTRLYLRVQIMIC
ncbi:hypothetical protein ALC60_14295 [Trachymyrmex zeteki]|uniref:FERM domain-containing protein n=1 Tax=Mycetomoellerius zeteki TaxID=64791 RepID=A0A151WG04_9HYME|nr:hypothetical protein ALC60_14295 [Trachymyrmex zeteki]